MDTVTLFSFFLYAFTAIFVIVNPISALFTFVSMTSSYPEKAKNMYAKRSVILAAAVALFFAIAGSLVLSFLGIGVDSLRVAGGILLFTIGYNMMTAKMTHSVTQAEIDESQDKDFWIFPIAIPLLCGPGLISTVIVLMGGSTSFANDAMVIFAILLVFVITYVGFYFSRKISTYLGYTGTLVITRLLGLFLAAIAVSMITLGLYNIYQLFIAGAV
ncbi:NAAT family transporter [Methanolapillus ohkumae]|uniref:UPF0056 membrane protein n=1 Tax=Methanolapillus ohkumae TaxID=3028298 RepID=A0AA96V5D8_9EURY|nr:hypothetical protein MsAm2_07130 [Methanosarcinaceae archaeon Am2]WNY26937.1 hypothetical protein MsAm2_07200 [Methanosarcinaceae archaeon Am2]WNY26944.1 hypothetical protein MsAm2_07270 [Methanosarcinaceae archaeon Am2]WNY26951.1 hypothetical protein MsAm2_07340 [Methanosarcinaceae archaeon Am2]WNY26958.1 hypothetical protein MsAm2_07410 [Methanosarcinaceae archaeon Am2]